MRARPDGILGLFLLYLSRYYFYDTISNAGPLNDSLRSGLAIGGFPLEVETVALFFITLRVFEEQLLRPNTYTFKYSQSLLFLWAIAFLPVLIGLYLGYQMRTPNWTGGFRYLMVIGSYFYGYILAKNWPRSGSGLLIPILLPFIFSMLLLMVIGRYWSHQAYLILSLSGAFSIYFIRKRFVLHRLFGILLLSLTTYFAVTHNTTCLVIALFAVSLSYLGTRRNKAISMGRNRIVKVIGGFASSIILIFTAYVTYLGFQPAYETTTIHVPANQSFVELAKSKALSDRLPIWTGAVKQILSGPYFVVSQRPIMELTGYPDGWWNGSHNAIIESLRVNGLFSGTIMLIILFFVLKKSFLVLAKSVDSVLKSLAAGILGAAIPGLAVNITVIDMTVGCWLLGLAGLCHGLFLQNKSLVESKQLLSFQTNSNFRFYAKTAEKCPS